MTRINDFVGGTPYDNPLYSDASGKRKETCPEEKTGSPADTYDIDLEISHEQKVPGDIQFATQTCGPTSACTITVTCATCRFGVCR